MANTPELQDHHIRILIKLRIQTKFYASLKHKIKECAFAAQEGHTSPKSHHKHLAKDFTSQNEGAPAKTYPASCKTSLNMCSTLQASQVI
jgi:hypothetical protein